MARPVDPFIFPSNQSGADPAALLSPFSRKPIPLRLGSGSQQTRRWRKESGANPSLEQLHASGDRLGQAGGRGYKRNGGSTPCASYHHRRKYVRAAQDRWAPQPRKSARHCENRALGRDNSIQRRTARDGRFPPRRALPLLGGFVVCPAVSPRLVTRHMQLVGKSSPPMTFRC
jgi:hypothetical protein